MMNTQLYCRNANDYLDLYLLARSLDDEAWQNEIMDSLHQCYGEMIEHDMKTMIQSLWTEYRKINSLIIDLYRSLRTNPEDETLKSKITILKHKRATLHRRIYMEEKGSSF